MKEKTENAAAGSQSGTAAHSGKKRQNVKELPMFVHILLTPLRLLTHFALRVWTVVMYRPKVYFDYPHKAKHKLVDRPSVVISNHLAGSDGGMLMIQFFRNRFCALVAREWVNKMALVVGPFRGISIDRYHGGVSWLRESVRRMEKGNSIIIFPEGFIEIERGNLSRFRPGFIQLARMAGAEVVPVYLEGYYSRFFRDRFRIMAGEPMKLSEQGDRTEREYYKEEALRYQARVEELRESLHARLAEEKDRKGKGARRAE